MNCQTCNKETKTKRCSLCHTGAYCSRECQTKHYKVHKDKCSKLQLWLRPKISKKVKDGLKTLKNNFRVFDSLPDILCDINTWKTYRGCVWDLVMLSELHLKDKDTLDPEKFSGEPKLYRELLKMGGINMITFLEGDRKEKKCFSKEESKVRAIEIGKEINEIIHRPNYGISCHEYMDHLFDYGFSCFPQWARQELYDMWRDNCSDNGSN